MIDCMEYSEFILTLSTGLTCTVSIELLDMNNTKTGFRTYIRSSNARNRHDVDFDQAGEPRTHLLIKNPPLSQVLGIPDPRPIFILNNLSDPNLQYACRDDSWRHHFNAIMVTPILLGSEYISLSYNTNNYHQIGERCVYGFLCVDSESGNIGKFESGVHGRILLQFADYVNQIMELKLLIQTL